MLGHSQANLAVPMVTVTTDHTDPENNGTDHTMNCSSTGHRQCIAEMQTDDHLQIICNGISCCLFNKMDVMLHDTLVKVYVDHFPTTEIEAAKQILYECDAVKKLGL